MDRQIENGLTDRKWTDRQTGRSKDGRAVGQTYRKMDRQADTHTHTHRQINGRMDQQTDREADEHVVRQAY